MNKLKYLFILLFIISTNIYSQTIELVINGETYTRNYPTNINEYKQLVDSLVSMYNNIDKKYYEVLRDFEESVQQNIESDRQTIQSNNDINSNINSTLTNLTEANITIDLLRKQLTKTRYGIGGNLNYIFNARFDVSPHIALYKNYNLFTIGPILSVDIDNIVNNNLIRFGFGFSYTKIF
jgi:hypothetical protein